MNLLVIRHAIAGDQEEWAKTGQPDEKRPVTDEGRKKMKRAAKGLQRIVERIDVLASSPYTRALETAEIVGEQYGEAGTIVVEELVPERPFPALLDWLKRQDDVDIAAIVGHEPHLSGFVSWLLTGREHSIIGLKKGAACMIEFTQPPEAGAGRLLWALTPAQLRQLG